jgi:hypothetical protein
MSKIRALSFACFMASIVALASVNSQAKAVLGCQEQETCNGDIGCGGSCACTCNGQTAWPDTCNWDPEGPNWYSGYCVIPYSAE